LEINLPKPVNLATSRAILAFHRAQTLVVIQAAIQAAILAVIRQTFRLQVWNAFLAIR